MKNFIIILFLLVTVLNSEGQFSKATLQASGLTCSMCSKAVKVALEKVDFVKSVSVNIKAQEYILNFNPSSNVEFDKLKDAVVDAGFSVASLKVEGVSQNLKVEKDSHEKIDGKIFHFLNGSGKQIQGAVTFKIVDKGFLSDKEFKKISTTSNMACVQTGKSSTCCEKAGVSGNTRIYHVVI
ncbi:MAG: hypothetical protein EPO57_03915 [Chitinophagaceae bacterium]|nr:MAG: hypothetical protein EPO57_03915 [Chitinophagaceae bacterium]